jgi:hypothetical protein
MTEPTSQSENTKDVIFKVVLPSYYTQFFDKVKIEDIPREIDIFGSLSYNHRFERDGVFYSLSKCDRTEEVFIKNYGNIDCESDIRRVTIVVEKYDDKVSIKVFDYSKKRRFGGKYFKKFPGCSYLTYNKKTNDLYYGTTSKVKRTKTSTIKRNRFECVQSFYKMLHTTCEGVKSNYYSQTDPICPDELIRSVLSAKTLSWNKFLTEIDSEFFKENFKLSEDEKFFKYYLVKRNIKYPDNFTNFLSLNTNNASTSSIFAWNNTSPTSSVFSVNTNGTDFTNASGRTYVAYCFAPIAGYSAFGTYAGNGSTDGPFVYLGFEPKFILAKRTNTFFLFFLNVFLKNVTLKKHKLYCFFFRSKIHLGSSNRLELMATKAT